MKPWLFILSVNIISLIMLMAIGFGILTGIGTACQWKRLNLIYKWFVNIFVLFFKPLKKDSKLYGDYCLTNNDCASSGNFICDKNRCSCSTTNWYSDTQCVSRYSYLASCSSSAQCLDNLVCVSNATSGLTLCQCNPNYFFSSTASYCGKR